MTTGDVEFGEVGQRNGDPGVLGVWCDKWPTDGSAQPTLVQSSFNQVIIAGILFWQSGKTSTRIYLHFRHPGVGIQQLACTWNETVSTTASQLVRDSNLQFPIDKLNRLPSHCDGTC
jgi:hypothetical protein